MIAAKIEKIWNPCQSRGYRPFFSRRCSSEIERVAVNTTSECGVIFMKTVHYAKAEKESLVGVIVLSRSMYPSVAGCRNKNRLGVHVEISIVYRKT